MTNSNIKNPIATLYSQEERQLLIDLAAAYRLIHYYGMTDMIYTHISLRIKQEPPVFLINPYGLMFDEICASNLVPIDGNGNKIDQADAEVNPAGFNIHSAIHLGCPDADAIIHTHTLSGMAVAAMEEGLLPLNQISMEFYNRVAYYDYEGISLDVDERERLVASLGDKKCLILRNHGLLTVGETVAEAFYYMYYLNKACEIQVNVLSSNAKVIIPPPEICEHTARQFEGSFRNKNQEFQTLWEANRRLLDRLDPSYSDILPPNLL
ncbi:class II aldolase/adducin family protein [Moorena producens JHB]|uniref:Class II aldolase/adducin family protein n=1 Tax=Moorena producens (strain JHB) TaxID=1454205 RepID=A0A1D9G276_MOOP1|nr:class II aldolase/adducin family protein [Moorena producens]AOY81726.1 class II aldolase/adducin family protein [Moorena producens JHB]